MGSLKGFLKGEIERITHEFRNNGFGCSKENILRVNRSLVSGAHTLTLRWDFLLCRKDNWLRPTLDFIVWKRIILRHGKFRECHHTRRSVADGWCPGEGPGRV